jgi:hypothetical protein
MEIAYFFGIPIKIFKKNEYVEKKSWILYHNNLG